MPLEKFLFFHMHVFVVTCMVIKNQHILFGKKKKNEHILQFADLVLE